MGGLLAIPAAFQSAIKLISEKGFIYCFRLIITSLYLTISRKFKKRRFDLYDYFSPHPERNSVLVPSEEWAVDPPRKKADLQKENDDVFCWGVNSKNEAVVAHISRQAGGKVLCSLYLRLQDGRIFTLPEEHRLQTDIAELNTFGSSRFKLQCLSPMRTWRLFFNGTLSLHSQDGGPDSDSQKFEHVKFTFMWMASSEVFDFTSDISIKSLSNFVASSSYFSSPRSLLKKLASILNCYEQPGMLLGTINIGNEDKREVHLWGVRGRYLGHTKELNIGNFEKTYVNFSNGAFMHFGSLTLPELSKKLQYGYLMRSDGFIHPILEFREETTKSTQDQIHYKFFSNDGYQHSLVRKLDETSNTYSFSQQFPGTTFIKGVDMKFNDFEGKGFILNGSIRDAKINQAPNIHKALKAMTSRNSSGQDLCLSFQNVQCQDSELTGGKGSSLGKLYALSVEAATKQTSAFPRFTVPNGVVVTTKAYKEFIKGSLQIDLDQFEKNVWSCTDDKIPALCQKITEEVKHAKLPKSVVLAIISNLSNEFKHNLSESKFAVRSSATGEDTEQMSAAGQMETFLGLKGTDQILDAVIKCWASQFTFQAVEYKRRYGQRLNTPMAVVIQEMVPCDIAGVCFTCDPVTGNPTFISITGNFGLGESVVSASSEPDTVVLERNINDTLAFHSQQLGLKKKKIIMDGESGTVEVDVEGDQTSQCCLNEEMALCLGKIAVAIENRYGSSRDLEWGILDKKIFLFQSRPVTSLDLETDFEAKHFSDTYLRTENECISKANVGEVMPAALSPIGLDVMHKLFNLAMSRQNYLKWQGAMLPQAPYFAKNVTIAFHNVFFCMVDGILGLDDDDFSKSMIISIFGRPVDLSPMKTLSEERHKLYRKPQTTSYLHLRISQLLAMFFGGKMCRSQVKKVNLDSNIQITENLTSKELFHSFSHLFAGTSAGANSHMYCTMASSMWNLSILTLLAKARGDFNNDVYSDFAYLLSTCTEIESADVPSAIQNVGHIISICIDVAKFKKMTPEEALKWLQTTKTEAGAAFKTFLSKHGHRCLKEFDVFTDTWEYNPMSLVKMLQSFVSENVAVIHKKELPSFSTILSKLHIQLSFWQKLKLRILLPLCQNGVRDREFSKSFLVRIFNHKRKPLKELSKILVKEGRLPRKELLFFLTIDEISQLIKTRSPRIVSKAFHRWKVHSELDKLKFPEIMYGIPKPSNYEKFDFVPNGDGVKMIGIPVSQGVVKATARVIVSIEDAVTIQRGDVLITYSTDIAWSPYFPLLSGVVTELGGLISHGAVVAREYGLPCVVGLHGATNVFKSGDVVVLDGNKGTVTKVD